MVLARHVLCAVGPWSGFAEVDRAVAVYGGTSFARDPELSALEHDPTVQEAFEASACSVHPSLTAAELARTGDHRAVAFVLSARFGKGDALRVATRALAVIGALLDAGATGVKAESAGIAHGAAQWHRYAGAAAAGDRLALRDAFVRRPIGDGTRVWSCGMHLLGLPDVEVDPSDDAAAWLEATTAAQLAGPLGSGDSVELGGQRRVLEAAPCARYDDEDPFFNPQGYLRVGRPGRRGLRRRR